MDVLTTYNSVAQRLADLTAVEEALGILHWDQEIVMPAGAADARGKQIATLSVVAHERLTNADLGAELQALSGHGALDETQKANIREALREHLRAARLPPRWCVHGENRRPAATISGFGRGKMPIFKPLLQSLPN